MCVCARRFGLGPSSLFYTLNYYYPSYLLESKFQFNVSGRKSLKYLAMQDNASAVLWGNSCYERVREKVGYCDAPTSRNIKDRYRSRKIGIEKYR